MAKRKAKGAKLDDYRAKRSFGQTPEPGDEPGGDGDGNRFVIQEHHATRLHWDLRLEHDGVLASWALPRGVPPAPDQDHLAVHTEDHPLAYLDFHGEIPEGQYGAGSMTIWDRGTYEVEKWEPKKVVVRFHGERVRGRYALFATRGKDWMIHRMDSPEEGFEPMPERLEPWASDGRRRAVVSSSGRASSTGCSPRSTHGHRHAVTRRPRQRVARSSRRCAASARCQHGLRG